MGATPTQTNAKKAAYLAAYEQIGTIRGAAEFSGVAASTHYTWLKEDEQYAADFVEAQKASSLVLEEEARRRAIFGWDEPVYQNGCQVGTKRKYSDTLLIFLMKGNHPAKFGDRIEQTHKGDADSPVTFYQLPDNGRE